MSKLEMVVEARVDDAVDKNPFRKARVVEVACSLVESLVQFHGASGQADLQLFEIQRLVVERLVVVAEVPVADWKVKFWRVEEELAKSPPLTVIRSPVASPKKVWS